MALSLSVVSECFHSERTTYEEPDGEETNIDFYSITAALDCRNESFEEHRLRTDSTLSKALESRRTVRSYQSSIPTLSKNMMHVRLARDPMAPATHEYVVHANLLTGRGAFWEENIKVPPESNAAEDSYDFSVLFCDLRPDTFEVYQQYLYNGILFTAATEPMDDDPEFTAEWYKLINAYVFGTYLGDNDFKDACIDGMLEIFRDIGPPTQEICIYIYEKVETGAILRDLVLEMWAYGAEDHHYETGLGLMSAEFSKNLNVKMFSRNKGVGKSIPRYEWSDCSYHEHGGGARGCWCEKWYPATGQ